MTRSRHGFTLIEMSIVLVIIGLIVSGVILGKSLIRNAELQAVIANVDRYKKAAGVFKEKYYYLPGDFPNAVTLWGIDTFNCIQMAGMADTDTPAPNQTQKTATCGGNGDGFIGGYNSGAFSTPVYIGGAYQETLRLWQHLADAGFIEGSYNGAGSTQPVLGLSPGLNIPSSNLSTQNGFIFFYASPIDSGNLSPSGGAVAGVYPGNYGHIIEYGSTQGVFVTQTLKAGLTGTDAASIDQKIDDGQPAYGNVLSFTPNYANTPSCAGSATPASATYVTSSENLTCALIFVTGL